MPLYIHLSPAAQKQARDWYRENCLDYEWWDSDYDHWKEKLSELGFTDADIKFSGFYSQGDGASFTAGVTREFKLPAAAASRIAEAMAVAKVQRRFKGLPAVVDLSHEVIFRITRDIHDRYVHPKTIRAEFSATYGDDMPEDLTEMLEAWAEQLSQYLTSEARDLSDQIYRDLEAEWDDLNSDDTVAEAITGNKWHFDEDGNFLPDRPRELQTAA
jgi:hypothetical protein